MLALTIALLLSQAPPVCDDGGVSCSPGGFKSSAGLTYGSGTPDFTCGAIDNLPDGGWGPQSKYCLFITKESENYNGYHGDLTIGSSAPRRAGWLFFLNNSAFGGPVFNVNWKGDVWSWGSYYASGNGGGLRNQYSYAVVEGNSTVPGLVPDVLAVGGTHLDGGFVFGVAGGGIYQLRVRDTGELVLRDVELRVIATDDALLLTQPLADGGSRTAALPWGYP